MTVPVPRTRVRYHDRRDSDRTGLLPAPEDAQRRGGRCRRRTRKTGGVAVEKGLSPAAASAAASRKAGASRRLFKFADCRQPTRRQPVRWQECKRKLPTPSGPNSLPFSRRNRSGSCRDRARGPNDGWKVGRLQGMRGRWWRGYLETRDLC